MTPDNESITPELRPASAASASPRGRRSKARRPIAAVVASMAVVGFSAALLAPTGMAVADPSSTAEDAVTAYSLAEQEGQNLTVTVAGADVAPATRGTFEVYVKPKPKPKPVVTSTEKSGKSTTGGGSAGTPKYTGGGSKEQWMTAAGIAKSDWPYVDYIVSRESGWNPNATNKSSGACGLVQALPCSKVPGNGYNPVDNLRWGTGYANGRYGGWAGAYAYWSRNHWW
ncbi:transglycosylase SLT domain-containing protein [Microbacterium sp. NPDC057650]|uniref:aggregation-promoting factor C-terminal-like domain-containing protein n=1 Tax=unclassified Microbacterium TaxID=2609290 RepID=UPI0036708E8F